MTQNVIYDGSFLPKQGFISSEVYLSVSLANENLHLISVNKLIAVS